MISRTSRLKSLQLFLVAVVSLFSIWGFTAPYGPDGMVSEFRQPDGTVLKLKFYGDEFYARAETVDGYTVVFDKASKSYEYAQRSKDGKTLALTGVKVGKGDPKALGLNKHLDINPEARKAIAMERFKKWDEGTGNSKRWKQIKETMQAADAKRLAAMAEGDDSSVKTSGDDPSMAPPGSTTLGTKVGVTILIDFSDDPATIPQADIESFCNADSYSGYGNNGSVKKYFQDNSSNQLTYTNVVTAYIRMAQPKSYYNVTTAGAGGQANTLIRDAIAIMKAAPGYDPSIFDGLTVDGSNRAIACNVFYAGGNGGVWSYGLWPHSWSLYNVGAQTLGNGKSIFKYQITNIGSSLSLGTFCHENGHMLCGYPDIYDYDYDSVGGAGRFCLMNSGGHGTNPVLINAYLRRASGWTTDTEVTPTSNFTASLTSTVGHADFNKIYRYANPAAPTTEYFLFENRQRTGRDANISASGIAIWHIDQLGDKDNQSLVPNSTHDNYECSLIQADNLWHFQNDSNSGDSKDLYYLGNTASAYTNTFNDASSPDANWWNGNPSGIQAYDFSASGATMTFQFGLTPNTVYVLSPNGGENIRRNSIHTISWSANITGDVDILLFKGGSLHSTLASNEANDGTYSWFVSSSLPVASDYAVQVMSVDNNTYEDTSNATFSIMANDLPEAVDATTLPWSTSGSADWFLQTGTTHDGVDAAESGNIADSQSTSLETTVTGPGTVTFWWKVSSESNYDYLIFYLDGVEQTGSLAKISGNINWTQKTVSIPSGSHTLKWSYSKDSSVDGGSDTAWVDQVVSTSASSPEIAVSRISGIADGGTDTVLGTTSTAGTQLTYQISNVGTEDLTVDTTVTPTGLSNCGVTVDTQPSSPVNPAGSTELVLTVSPTADGAWSATISITNNDNDENPFNWTISGTAVTPYTVTLDQGSGTGGTTSVQVVVGSPMPAATPPTYAGYAFGGYYTEVDGAGIQYYTNTMASARNWDIAADTTLYAKWTARTYIVTFNANGGGAPAPASKSVTFNEPYGALATVSRTGYNFNGWYTLDIGGSLVESTTTVTETSNHTLYAQWTVNNYTVTLDPQSGAGSPATVTATYGAAMPTPTAAPTRATFTFAGYFAEVDGGGTQYYTATMASANNWDIAADTTIYAYWIANLPYTVTLDPSPGTGGTASVTATYGSPMPAATAPSRTGYTFAGYYSEASGGGTQYYTAAMASATTWDISSATTLYADWTANTYLVTLDPQLGTGGDTSVSATYDSAMPAATAPALSGFTFAGYFSELAGAGTQYYADTMASTQNWDIASATTLYAKWDANVAPTVTTEAVTSITHNSAVGNGTITFLGIPNPTQHGVCYGTNPTPLVTGNCTYENTATAVGSFTSSMTGLTPSTTYYVRAYATNIADTAYGNEVTFTTPSAPPTYTVTYFANATTDSGTVPVDTTDYLDGAPVTVMGNLGSLVRTGYTLSSWNTAANGSGQSYTAGATFNINGADVQLYAQWTVNTYNVSYYANTATGGTAPTDTTDYVFGESVTVAGNTGNLVKAGNWFAGWNTVANGSGIQYWPSQTFSMPNADVMLYAQWTSSVPSATVRYDANGATGGAVPVDNAVYASGQPVSVMMNTYLWKDECEFVEWNTSPNGQGTGYAEGETFSHPGSDVTLYAQWHYGGSDDTDGDWWKDGDSNRWKIDSDGCSLNSGGGFANILPVLLFIVAMCTIRFFTRRRSDLG